jgi:hypothetical protein
MPDVARVPAFKIGYPMPFRVLMKTSDGAFHTRENDDRFATNFSYAGSDSALQGSP